MEFALALCPVGAPGSGVLSVGNDCPLDSVLELPAGDDVSVLEVLGVPLAPAFPLVDDQLGSSGDWGGPTFTVPFGGGGGGGFGSGWAF